LSYPRTSTRSRSGEEPGSGTIRNERWQLRTFSSKEQ
jgi:hypothetical protein